MRGFPFSGWMSAMILCWGLMMSGPSFALAQDDIPAELLDVNCSVLHMVGLSLVADYFYADETDKALSMIMYVESECGSIEAVRRIQLLGSIWDGSFNESLYDSDIISDLAFRTGKEQSDLGFAYYDSFTTYLADQLLPHTERESLEEFFCLFHSGREDEAYAMLQGETLKGTNLEYYYGAELRRLDTKMMYGFGGVYGSYWRPSGHLARLGHQAMAGLMLGGQYGEYFGRINFGFRFNRALYPYYVDHNDEMGWSDRTNGIKMTMDFGTSIFKWNQHEVGGFVGAGIDVLMPFHEVEDYTIHSMLAHVGLEYKLWLGEYQNWNITIDARKEWYGSWSGDGTDMSGDGWDFRIGVGIAASHGEAYKRRVKLGYE